MKKLGFKSFHLFTALIIVYIVVLAVFSKNATHFSYGDGPEYVMMTESFLNHGSPNLKLDDAKKYLRVLDERGLKVPAESQYLKLLNKSNGDFLFMVGYYQSTKSSQLWYSYHFWMYPLFCVPVRFVLGKLKADIRITFLATNLLIIFIAIWVISRLKKFSPFDRLCLSLLVAFSPTLWYIDWPHPEVFSGVLVFLAMVLFFHGNKYWALFCASLATTQNLPIGVLSLFIFVSILSEDGIRIKVLSRLFIASFWCVLSPLFYLFYFNTTSLISESGVLSTDLISFHRFWHFFFDLNQGIILGIPLILLSLIGLLCFDLIKKHPSKVSFLLLSIPIMSLLFMQMSVWNDGNSVIKRYAIWVIPILVCVFYFRIKTLPRAAFLTLITVVIVSQPFVLFSQIDFNKIYWHANNFSKVSEYVFNHYPSLYNPDPQVFRQRVNPFTISTTDSVTVYTNPSGIIMKMLVKKGSIGQLEKRGVPEGKVEELNQSLNYRNGYAYINKSQLDAIGYKQETDKYIDVIEQTKLDVIRAKIRENINANPAWVQKIQLQSDALNISLDSGITLNVEYLISQGIQKDEQQ